MGFLNIDCEFFMLTGEPKHDTFKAEGKVLFFWNDAPESLVGYFRGVPQGFV